jgi:hypothetical protein
MDLLSTTCNLKEKINKKNLCLTSPYITEDETIILAVIMSSEQNH